MFEAINLYDAINYKLINLQSLIFIVLLIYVNNKTRKIMSLTTLFL